MDGTYQDREIFKNVSIIKISTLLIWTIQIVILVSIINDQQNYLY